MSDVTPTRPERGEHGHMSEDRTGWAATALGGLGALGMTACCILPLVLFSLGATGAWIARMGALYRYRWYFLAFAGASLAYGFWKVYRPETAVCADGDCTLPISRRVTKTSLWAATALVAASLVFPYVSPFLLGY